MSLPIVEQIAVKLVEAVNAITTANGFNYDLTAVRPKRLHLESDLNDDLSVIIEQEDPVKESQTESTITWRQAFTLQAIAIDSDDSTEAIDTKLNKIRADIEKHLLNDTYNTCGGLAEGIMLRAPERFVIPPAISGVAVNIDVWYTTEYADPYTQET